MTSGRFSRFLDFLTKERSIGPLHRLSGYIRSLPHGDRFIVGMFAVVLTVASLVSVVALTRSVMVEVPAHGGSLVEGSIGSPRFVNPLFALTDADRDMTALTFAGLMGLDAQGVLVPVLADHYSVSPDGKMYTFVIRQSATFSDGTPVTAEDVVFTIEKAQDPGLKSPEYANWANIRAEVVDARTVRFTLPKPYAPFIHNTTLGILPAHVWRNIPNDRFAFSPLMQKPVGAGPFKVVKAVTDKDGSITEYRLAVHSGFAPGRAYLDHITMKFFADQSALRDAYKAGKVESAYGVVSSHTIRAPYARVFGVFFNKKENAALGRLEVRKALSIAVDRDHIVDDLLGGNATSLSGPVPGGEGVTLPSSADRIETARQLLMDNGWIFDPDLGTWKHAKAKLSLDTITIKTSNVPELRTLAAAVQADWQELGVPVSLEFYEPGDLTKEVIRPRAYQALYFGMVIGRSQDLYAFWDSNEQTDPGLNIAGYADKTVDTLLEKARTEQNSDKARELLADASARIAQDYPAAFTHAPDFLYAVPKTLYGVALPQIASPADRFATVASWYRERAYVWPVFAESH